MSRKAFDSTSGGGSSPILPDGRLVPIPIPSGASGVSYDQISWEPGSDLGSLMEDLGLGVSDFAHHDPDLNRESLPREAGWRPIFGQAGNASQHLANQGVGPGDIFLFFGRFRPTQMTSTGLRFVGSPVHVIWGYLEVDEVREPASDPAPPAWAKGHPHYACTTEPWFGDKNRVYIARDCSTLVRSLPGGGVIPYLRDAMRLSADGGPMSKWRLPLAMHPSRSGVPMSNTSPSEWSMDSTNAYLQAVGQRQEFVIAMSPEIEDWVRRILTIGAGPGPARFDQFWGIDFSGAQDAGRSIWITKAVQECGALRVTSVAPLTRRRLSDALDELRQEIRRAGHTLIGLDFPFGLPRDLIHQASWSSFLTAFADEYANPDQFRSVMYERARSVSRLKELRRKTDDLAKTPWSPYNLRLYRQTFHGIRDVLAPLVGATDARVLPMQTALEGKPTLIEICPRSTMRALGHGAASTPDVLDRLAERGISLSEPDRTRILGDSRGDARDSAIAAFAVWRSAAMGELYATSDGDVEGRVFVGVRPGSHTNAAPPPRDRTRRPQRGWLPLFAVLLAIAGVAAAAFGLLTR